MPIKQSAKKALRQTIKHTVRNVKILSDIKTTIKKIRRSIELKQDKKKIEEMIKSVQKMLDKAVKNKILKKNNGARKLSRLMAYLNKGNKPVEAK